MPAKTTRSFELGRIAGVQIGVDYSWFIIFALVLASLSAGYFPHQYPGRPWIVYLLVGIGATFLFFASVLTHELSHAIVANRLGEEVRRITLFIFGGVAHLTSEPKNADVELKIAGVGPLTSLALGGLFWVVAYASDKIVDAPMWVAMFEYLALINVALAVFNLLPGFPLDGGRLARAFFWKRSGNLRQATQRAAGWGSGIAIGIMVLGALQIFTGALVGGLWLILIGLFLRGAAQAGYQGLVLQQTLGEARVREIMVSNPITVPAELSVADVIESYFLRHGYGGFPVADNGAVKGIVSLAQVRECPPEERATRSVRDIMRCADDEIRIGPEAPVSEALRKMVEGKVGRLLVVEGSECVGLITRTGVTRYVGIKTALEEGGEVEAPD